MLNIYAMVEKKRKATTEVCVRRETRFPACCVCGHNIVGTVPTGVSVQDTNRTLTSNQLYLLNYLQ